MLRPRSLGITHTDVNKPPVSSDGMAARGIIAMPIDLEQAARLTRYNFKDNFLPTLHDWELLEYARAERIAALQAKLQDYRPDITRELPIPKSSLLTRPASLPVVDDWIVYTAVVVAIARSIEAALVPPQQGVLFSFRWNENDPVRMIRRQHEAYQGYRTRSLALLERYPYALETDVAAYFENIDLPRLRDVLLGLGADNGDVTFLVNRLLDRWTHRSGRGIPQGPWASSYLANAFLDSVDKAMLARGLTHVRYQDDIRVFCRDASQAKMAILELTELTRELGLTIQTAKTQIYSRKQAAKKWRGYGDWLAEIEQGKLEEQLRQYFERLGPYGDASETDFAIEVEQKALNNLFELVTRKPAYKVDRKGLKFAMFKMGEIPSDHALDYCIRNLAHLPDLAPDCSQYLSHFADREDVQNRVLQFISSRECVFDWQAMHLVAGLMTTQAPIQPLLGYMLRTAMDRNKQFCLRSACVDFIGKLGSPEAIRSLCRSFPGERYEEVRAAIILATRTLPRAERKNVLKPWTGISPSLDAAIAIALAAPPTQ